MPSVSVPTAAAVGVAADAGATAAVAGTAAAATAATTATVAGISTTSLLAAGSIGATVIGAGISYMGVQNQEAAASNQAKYNATIAANDQTIANQEATDTLSEANVQQQQKAYQTEQAIGAQKAALGANNVDVNSGSAVSLLSDTAAAGTLDQLTIQNNAQRVAVGYKNQGINFSNQATLDESASAEDTIAGNIAGAKDVITGAGQVAGQWYNYTTGTKQSGLGGLV